MDLVSPSTSLLVLLHDGFIQVRVTLHCSFGFLPRALFVVFGGMLHDGVVWITIMSTGVYYLYCAKLLALYYSFILPAPPFPEPRSSNVYTDIVIIYE